MESGRNDHTLTRRTKPEMRAVYSQIRIGELALRYSLQDVGIENRQGLRIQHRL